ncbi:MAG: hypothetical protein WDW38_009094 [Sanguina aurantia]
MPSVTASTGGEKMLVVKGGDLTDEEIKARVILGVASGLLGAITGAVGSFLFRKYKGMRQEVFHYSSLMAQPTRNGSGGISVVIRLQPARVPVNSTPHRQYLEHAHGISPARDITPLKHTARGPRDSTP